MEIKEAIAVVIKNSDAEDCWYCKEAKKDEGPKSNLERGDVAGLREKVEKKNDLPWMNGRYGAMLAEAHHLIAVRPMADMSSLHEYIEAKHGVIEEDIGYDLNHPKNSVWLPGRPIPTDKEDKIAVINDAEAQIHNSNHPDYRNNVYKMLEELYNKIKKNREDGACPLCGATMDNKQRAPYGLVGRLDKISKKLRELLTGIPEKWLLDQGYYTFSRELKDQVKIWISEGAFEEPNKEK